LSHLICGRKTYAAADPWTGVAIQYVYTLPCLILQSVVTIKCW